MAYTPDPRGYAQTNHEIADAIAFCDTLGGDEYDYAKKYMDCVGIIPDWLKARMCGRSAMPCDYIVTHAGREYEVSAKSEAQAINNVRFRLYKTRPIQSLPPFSARVAERKWNPPKTTDGITRSTRLSRADIASRLRRMAS